jgi:hypothetical protein
MQNMEVYIFHHKSNIVILERNLSEIGAFALERRYIEWYGRKEGNILNSNI